ncbi:MAG: type II secretion system F family protein, partial [Desulfobacterales bacterium]
FAVLLRAGLPIVNALDAIAEKDQESELNRIITDIRADIAAGESLSGAFEKYSHVFSGFYAALLQAGEKSGDIVTVIARYMEYMKKAAEIRQKALAASVYPIILTVVSVFTLVFLLVFVVPAFTQAFFDAGTELPAMTMLLIRLSTLIRDFYAWLILFAVSVILGCGYFYRSAGGRMAADRWKTVLPFISGLYRNYAASILARTLSTILGGGTPLVEAVRVSAGVLENRFLRLRMEEVIKKLGQGDGFADSLAETDMMPKLAVKMIRAGENSGSLEQVLRDIADFYDADVEARLSVLSSVIEPGLMVLMGFLIGFIVLAMYMPVFQLAGTVS